jgi:hypothetical protein
MASPVPRASLVSMGMAAMVALAETALLASSQVQWAVRAALAAMAAVRGALVALAMAALAALAAAAPMALLAPMGICLGKVAQRAVLAAMAVGAALVARRVSLWEQVPTASAVLMATAVVVAMAP